MMKKQLSLFVLVSFILSACNFLTSEGTSPDTQASQTAEAEEMATAAMEQARRELVEGQTATAGVEQAAADALATSISEAVAETLTAMADIPVDSPTPADTQTEVPPPLELPTDTPTLVPSDTLTPLPPTAAPQSCYVVLDNWCTTHQGCSTVDVRNQSGMSSYWHIWSDKTGIDASFTVPAGPCTIETRPGKYNFYVTYCGDEVADFAWQLNDNWWYKISPCED